MADVWRTGGRAASRLASAGGALTTFAAKGKSWSGKSTGGSHCSGGVRRPPDPEAGPSNRICERGLALASDHLHHRSGDSLLLLLLFRFLTIEGGARRSTLAAIVSGQPLRASGGRCLELPGRLPRAKRRRPRSVLAGATSGLRGGQPARRPQRDKEGDSGSQSSLSLSSLLSREAIQEEVACLFTAAGPADQIGASPLD